MSYAVNDAVNQVLSRIGEAANSTIGELPSGTGPAASPTITNAAQIVTFLTEAGRELVKQGVLELYGSASYASVPAGTMKALYTAFTYTNVGQAFWRPTSATWNSAAVQVCDRQWYEVHNPTIAADANGTPVRVYVDVDGVLIAPKPSSSAQTLALYGLVLPRGQTAGTNIVDVPDHLVPAMIWWACNEVASKHAGDNERLHAATETFRAKWLEAIGRSQ